MDKIEIDKLFEENQKLIYFVINNFVKDKDNLNVLCSPEDLFQVGSIALFHAITSYNPRAGAFSTYATNVIRNRIYNELRDTADRPSDQSISVDDEDTSFIENEVALRYNNIHEQVENEMFAKIQKEVLFDIAKKYTGVAKKGVLALHLTTEGYSCKAIAKIFKVDAKTLTAWISRARSKLKEEPEILRLFGKDSVYG